MVDATTTTPMPVEHNLQQRRSPICHVRSVFAFLGQGLTYPRSSKIIAEQVNELQSLHFQILCPF